MLKTNGQPLILLGLLAVVLSDGLRAVFHASFWVFSLELFFLNENLLHLWGLKFMELGPINLYQVVHSRKKGKEKPSPVSKVTSNFPTQFGKEDGYPANGFKFPLIWQWSWDLDVSDKFSNWTYWFYLGTHDMHILNFCWQSTNTLSRTCQNRKKKKKKKKKKEDEVNCKS